MYYLFFVIGWIEGDDIIVNDNTTNKLIATMDCAFKILINVYLFNTVYIYNLYIYFIDKFIFNCFIDPNYVTVVNTFNVSIFYYHSLQYV